MGRQRFSVGSIVRTLREAEVERSHGRTVGSGSQENGDKRADTKKRGQLDEFRNFLQYDISQYKKTLLF
jgi:hypothetical protein